MADVLLREVRDGVVLLTLNRPDQRNAVNQELRTALAEAMHDFAVDPELRVAVITGAGDAVRSAPVPTSRSWRRTRCSSRPATTSPSSGRTTSSRSPSSPR